MNETASGTRPETGPMSFGDDWPGVFIRGDNAYGYAMTLRRILERAELSEQESKNIRDELWGLISLLLSCQVGLRPDLRPMRTQGMTPYQKAHEGPSPVPTYWTEEGVKLQALVEQAQPSG
jgi:hypothetical protein